MHKAILSVELIIIVLGGKATTTTNFKPVVYDLLLGVPVFVIVGCPVFIHFSSCLVKDSYHCRHCLNYSPRPNNTSKKKKAGAVSR